ncbi:hypothetical protein Tco_0231691 [Tanacetum coccineum]
MLGSAPSGPSFSVAPSVWLTGVGFEGVGKGRSRVLTPDLVFRFRSFSFPDCGEDLGELFMHFFTVIPQIVLVLDIFFNSVPPLLFGERVEAELSELIKFWKRIQALFMDSSVPCLNQRIISLKDEEDDWVLEIGGIGVRMFMWHVPAVAHICTRKTCWEVSRVGYGRALVTISMALVWKSVEYGVSNGLDTAYWGFLGVGTTFDIFQNIILIPYLEYGVLSPLDTAYWSLIFCGLLVSAGTDTPYLLDGYGVLVFRIVIFKISSFKLQNARLLLSFTNYSIITAILKYKRLSNNSLQ